VKRECVIYQCLQSFSPVEQFPPDIAHDLLEGILPIEIALCLDVLISREQYGLHLADVNQKIATFHYRFQDRVNKSQKIPLNFAASGTIGGNATENWTLIRLLLTMNFSSCTMIDFNNELVSLTDIQELEQFSTVSVVSIQVADAAECVASNSQVVAKSSSSNMRQGMGWPDEFVLPKFDHDIELLLTKGNEEYSMNGKLLNLSKANKGAVLKKFVNSMYDIKAYPQVSEFRSVAQTLVAKYPCLQEPGSRSGFDGWTNSLVFKMGNYRTEIRKAGAEEVKVNGGRRSRYV